MRIGGWRQIGGHRRNFDALARPASLLSVVLGRVREGPPTHVLRGIAGSRLERFDVVDNVSRTGALDRTRGWTRMFCTKCTDRRRVPRNLSAQVAHAVEAGGRVVGARRWKFGNHAELGVQDGADRQRERSEAEGERVFRGHRQSECTLRSRRGAPALAAVGHELEVDFPPPIVLNRE